MTYEIERDMDADDYWELHSKYIKLLEFVKSLIDIDGWDHAYQQISYSAKEILKEIGYD